MKLPSSKRSILWPLLQRPAVLTTLSIALLLVVTLALLITKSWYSVQRLEPLKTHTELLDRLQSAGHHAQYVLIESFQRSTAVNTEQLGLLRTEIAQVRALSGYLHTQTAERLDQAERVLSEPTADPGQVLNTSLSQLRTVIETEAKAYNALLKDLQQEADVELGLAVAVAAVVMALAAVLVLYLRWRVATPLNDLGRLMNELAEQQFGQASTQDVDPLLIPLFDHYNAMSSRLEALENQQRQYQQRLERDVHTSSKALLAQQQALGNAQRLALVGELALSLAHELRNPLAGIQAALSNLQSELAADPDYASRMAQIVAEVKRVTRLLNELLGQARQPAEFARQLALKDTIEDLLSLLRYQLPTTLCLLAVIPAALVCWLPPDRFRQALLNLVLNAAQSIGDRPGTVTISAALQEQVLKLSVTDDGPGFSAALLASGVRPFTSQRAQGTGLGLAVVRRFATDLGGELHLSNAPGGGARALLLLPQKEA